MQHCAASRAALSSKRLTALTACHQVNHSNMDGLPNTACTDAPNHRTETKPCRKLRSTNTKKHKTTTKRQKRTQIWKKKLKSQRFYQTDKMKKRSNNTALSHVRLPVCGQLVVLFCVSGSGDFGGSNTAALTGRPPRAWPSAARLGRHIGMAGPRSLGLRAIGAAQQPDSGRV